MARSSSILPVRLRDVGRGGTRDELMPGSIRPMLALASQLPPDPDHWSFEYKWDGVRAIGYWDGTRLKLESRNLVDVTRRYPELHALGAVLSNRRTILDGEILTLDADGRPSFARLQHRMHAEGEANIRRLMRETPVWYALFDVLWAGDRSTMALPYRKRRQVLEELTIAGPAWQITPAHIGDGQSVLRAAERNRLEGVVAKRLDSVYEPGRRSPNWLKIKVVVGQEFVIGAWVPEKGGNHDRVGALLMGYFECPGAGRPARLRYAGKVGTGFNAATHAMLTQMLKQRRAERSPFAERLPRGDVVFVTPDLVAEVEFRRWPESGLIQQASFKGLREDKNPKEVVNERQGGLLPRSRAAPG